MMALPLTERPFHGVKQLRPCHVSATQRRQEPGWPAVAGNKGTSTFTKPAEQEAIPEAIEDPVEQLTA